MSGRSFTAQAGGLVPGEVGAFGHWEGLEAAVVACAHDAARTGDWPLWRSWTAWLDAARETAELHRQSLQMGQALVRLVAGMAEAGGGVDQTEALLGHLSSWAASGVSAAVRLGVLGQTAGQAVLATLHEALESHLA